MNQVLTDWVGGMMNRLVEIGVRDVVISPGSRSTPLAIAAYLHPSVRQHVIVDERSAAFFALGLTRSYDEPRPVALVCTSGTAATNYYSAVAEANISQLPLIVLTTDRPPELRRVGAPQAIDQVGLYGSHVKDHLDLPVPESVTHSYMEQMVRRLGRLSQQVPVGPVHLNVPFREPLLPDIERLKQLLIATPVSYEPTWAQPTAYDIKLFNETVHQKRVACFVGPGVSETLLSPLYEWSVLHNVPLFVDPLSDMRQYKRVLTNYDTWLATNPDTLRPDVFIRIGAAPVSKRLNNWLNESTQIVIEQPGSYREPGHNALVVYGHPQTFLGRCQIQDDREYYERLHAIERIVESEKKMLTGESALAHALLQSDIETLFVSNSMPIRDVDTTMSANSRVRVLANRGANGIDGILSSALGAAYDSEESALLIGDLAFFHDSNALSLLKTQPNDFSVVVSNNNGGGIFSFLPQADIDNDMFEALFGTALDLDIAGFANTYGLSYRLIEHPDDVRAAIDDRVQLIEFRSNRDQNVSDHREWTARVGERLREAGLLS